jgi:hypothetical protein
LAGKIYDVFDELDKNNNLKLISDEKFDYIIKNNSLLDKLSSKVIDLFK